MRTWQKATLGLFIGILAIVAALGGTSAYFIMRSMEKRVAGEVEANNEMDALRRRYEPRAPLVEIVEPRTGDIRINREQGPAAAPVSTIHIISWESKENELVRTEIPLWLMRFSSLNLLSKLGIAPAKFRLTIEDVQRYGPGIVADYRSPGSSRALLWVD